MGESQRGLDGVFVEQPLDEVLDFLSRRLFGNSSVIRNLHYIQFRKDREYERALQEDEFLRKISVESVGRIDMDSMENDHLLDVSFCRHSCIRRQE